MKQKPESAESCDPTQPSSSSPETTASQHTIPSALVELDLAAKSHPGNIRPQKEDHYLIIKAKRSVETTLTNLPKGLIPGKVDEIAYGLLVAAGLGGMPAGQMASAIAISELMELVVNTPDWIMKLNRQKTAVVKRRMSERFHMVDDALRQHAETDPGLTGMGATLTVACILGADLFLGHIGDSRAYLLRGEQIHQLTRDHTLAQAMADAGISESENAVVHTMRRVVTAALGTAQLKVDIQVQHLQLCDQDQLLLCNHGLTESVDPETIASILRSAATAENACSVLCDLALNGGDDDVTVVLARYRLPHPVSESDKSNEQIVVLPRSEIL